MSYTFNKITSLGFDDAIEATTEALKERGFGILTEIDVTQTLKDKLDVDFRKYHILGACNPPFAYRALQIENKIGSMLPCNVIIQEFPDGRVEVAAIDPVASMQAVGNAELATIAQQIQTLLKDTVDSLPAA